MLLARQLYFEAVKVGDEFVEWVGGTAAFQPRDSGIHHHRTAREFGDGGEDVLQGDLGERLGQPVAAVDAALGLEQTGAAEVLE